MLGQVIYGLSQYNRVDAAIALEVLLLVTVVRLAVIAIIYKLDFVMKAAKPVGVR